MTDDLVERLRGVASLDEMILTRSWVELRATLTEAADALSSREGGEGWRPIETAPLDRFVLLAIPADGEMAAFVAMAKWQGRGWYGIDDEGLTFNPILAAAVTQSATHWRPLPEPPALSREGGEGVQHEPEVNHAKPLSTEAEGH